VNRTLRSITFWLLLILIAVSLVNLLEMNRSTPIALTYTDFVQKVDGGLIAEAKIIEGQVTGKLTDGRQFSCIIPQDPTLYEKMRLAGVKMTFDVPPQPSLFATLLTTLGPVVLVIVAFFFIMQQTQGGGSKVMQFGKSRAKLHAPEDRRKVTFDDVAGAEEVKEELQEIVDYLKHPKRYAEIGARVPKGVLLMGAPGTGKTWVARAVAGEAGVPFFSISGSDFVEMFVGVGASRVRDLFDQAKKSSPCIVFIDEIDAVGRQRGAGYGGGHDEREQTLNQLLVEMDGFGANEGIIVMAATNRPDILDPALLRPGRFDRQITIDKPDIKGRIEVLRVHGRGKPLDPKVDMEILARRTPGFTPADLENVMNEGALLAARRRHKKVGMDDLEEAIDRVVAGPEKKARVLSAGERRIVAFHEAAHAIVSRLIPHGDPVHKVSVLPRGAALGYTLPLPTEDRHLVTKAELLARVAGLLAGRAAEEIVFSETSTGAHDDLDKATRMVRRMVTEFGMSGLGPLTFGNRFDSPFLGRDLGRERDYSEEVAAEIDREVRQTVHGSYQTAKDILTSHRNALDRVAQSLLEREVLDGPELEKILVAAGVVLPTLARSGAAGDDKQAEAPSDASQAPADQAAGASGPSKPSGKRLAPKEALSP
jgi:cell division protease FtsH